MKLRVAKKILALKREGCYTAHQLTMASIRYEKTRSSKDAHLFWNNLMGHLSVDERAALLPVGMAFELLMLEGEYPESSIRVRISVSSR